MRKFLTLAAISATALTASSLATASVFYDYDVPGIVEVTFTVDDFLTYYGEVSADDIDSCTVADCYVS